MGMEDLKESISTATLFYNVSTSKFDAGSEFKEFWTAEPARTVHIIMRPILVTFGTIGNMLSFYSMRRGSLKNVSTCFYMAILALADTGISFVLYSMQSNKKTIHFE